MLEISLYKWNEKIKNNNFYASSKGFEFHEKILTLKSELDLRVHSKLKLANSQELYIKNQ